MITKLGRVHEINILGKSLFRHELNKLDIALARHRATAPALVATATCPSPHVTVFDVERVASVCSRPRLNVVYCWYKHGKWAIKALEKGKHVLLEKAFAANDAEARRVIETAQRTLQHDKVLQTHAIMTSPVCSIPASDIRWQFDLAGGALMDVTYVLSSTRFALDAGAPLCVKSAHTRPSPWDERVDEAMDTTLVYREGSAEGAEGEYNVEATVYADMRRANVAGLVPRVWELPTIEVETERALVTLYNFTMPHRVLYHYIATKDKATGETRYETHYLEVLREEHQ
ncbi:uncharacterized protein C8Q71DRAFT_722014 [Rhodofomes roseus]|uniref:D-xylose 1-dehydrogenase (NADP(+), D-xylono-1,5-lactone-forming) n=1 Tax=Rhodofomes roseus TaxID=34475 RepID=A0ABQ8KQ79_9APHY|nr:uncharacterized protein C8Q71DRAFT_722014 [Rhodofomes roseus]KAH9840328.1 hypothetical protein C8Q71DRAFT_722014 [Rhodofomes roseus]